jgi:hypothetical protein
MQTESLAMSGSSAGKRFFEARDARPQIATERSFLLVETESESKCPRQIAGIRQTTGNLEAREDSNLQPDRYERASGSTKARKS